MEGYVDDGCRRQGLNMLKNNDRRLVLNQRAIFTCVVESDVQTAQSHSVAAF